MRHRLLTAVLSTVLLFVFAFGISACEVGEPAHIHSYTDTVIDPTCTEKGYTYHVCECGYSYKDKYTDALGHTEVADRAVDATCTETGLTAGRHCSVCGTVFVEQRIIAALGHNYGDDGICTRCGEPAPAERLEYAEFQDYCVVTGIGTVTDNDVIIPSTYNTKTVREVEGGAFENIENLTSITIPDSVTRIGERAFYNCENLKIVVAGGGLTAIGKSAFGKCENLERVYLTNLGGWCEVSFENMSANPLYFAKELYINGEPAADITIPDTVKRVSKYAFYDCSGITGVDTGNGVTEISENAFFNCENLKSVIVGDSVTEIGDSAFSNCVGLENLVLGKKVKNISEYAFAGCSSLIEVEIPASVKTIGECAFLECGGLQKIKLNYGLESIGDYAFGACIKLGSLIMPDSVTKIGVGMAMFDLGNAGFVGGVMENELTEVVLSNSLTEIPDFAFCKSNILNIRIGEKVTHIRYSSFYGCGMLKSIYVPVSVKTVDSFSFLGCTSLESVFYGGTESDWKKMFIGTNPGNDGVVGNITFINATRYYYSENRPEKEGNFWHYVDGEITVWQ